MDDISFHSDECPERTVVYGEVKETISPLLTFWKEYGGYLNQEAIEHLCFYFDIEQDELERFLTQVEEDEARFKLWDYTCPMCESFLGDKEEVYAIQYHSRIGSYRLICGNCHRKTIIVQSL